MCNLCLHTADDICLAWFLLLVWSAPQHHFPRGVHTHYSVWSLPCIHLVWLPLGGETVGSATVPRGPPHPGGVLPCAALLLFLLVFNFMHIVAGDVNMVKHQQVFAASPCQHTSKEVSMRNSGSALHQLVPLNMGPTGCVEIIA